MTYGPSPGSHSHDHFQVLWSLQGNLELEIEGKGVNLSAGTGIIIAPDERHNFESHNANRCLVLNTKDAGWAARPRVPCSIDAIDHLARYIQVAISSNLPISYELSSLLLAQTWGNSTARRRFRRPIDWGQLTNWVKSQLSTPLTAMHLAEQVNLSESQFRARCYAELGYSPMQWLRRLRYDQARVLRAKGMSVADIARHVGYDSPSALTAAIRRDQS